MKKSLIPKMEKLFEQHNVSTHAPVFSISMELDELGVPSQAFIRSACYPLETLGIISLLRDELDRLEDTTKKQIEKLKGGPTQFMSTPKIVGNEGEIKPVETTKAPREGDPKLINLKHLKDLF
jgi:hypothetical protein